MTDPLVIEAAIKFLNEAARYFEKRNTGGEDMAFWANTYNADNCRKIATLLQAYKTARRDALEAAAKVFDEKAAHCERLVRDTDWKPGSDSMRLALLGSVPEYRQTASTIRAMKDHDHG